MSVAQPQVTGVLAALNAINGETHVLTDEHSCCLYAQDFYVKEMPALAVVQPENTQALAASVAAAVEHGHAVIARGGGMSYTGGYAPKQPHSIIIDMSRMNKVLEVNTEDMYVTVECGCTWQDLHQALENSGYRTPYWGTLSGIQATVGGGLSQNSIFWGSTKHGSAVESVVALEVVLADGSVVSTGALAQQNSGPFFRHYGPDLTGLFTCDTGALGFKATATLKLIPRLPAQRFASFDFADESTMVRAMSDIARAGLVEECFSFDPYLQQVRMRRESITSDVKKLAGVMRSGDGLLGALKDGAKVALAGRGYMKNVQYSMHVMIEERIDAAADDVLEQVRAIGVSCGGKEIENSIPKILRANPFTPLNNVVGPDGERWLPVHTIVPHSKANSMLEAMRAVFSKHQALIDQHEIGIGYLFALISTNGFVIEPVFYTPDSLNEIHHDTMDEKIMRKLNGFEERPDARAAIATVRADLMDAFRENGGVHMQIGKSYPYREGLRADSWQLLEQIKTAVDPKRLVNPGSLGLD